MIRARILHCIIETVETHVTTAWHHCNHQQVLSPETDDASLPESLCSPPSFEWNYVGLLLASQDFTQERGEWGREGSEVKGHVLLVMGGQVFWAREKVGGTAPTWQSTEYGSLWLGYCLDRGQHNSPQTTTCKSSDHHVPWILVVKQCRYVAAK